MEILRRSKSEFSFVEARKKTSREIIMNNRTNIEFEQLRYGVKRGFFDKSSLIVNKSGVNMALTFYVVSF